MQEPHRLNLLKVLQKNLIQANRRTYIHRIIYVIFYKEGRSTGESWLRILEDNVRAVNEDKWEEPLAGLALVTDSNLVNTIEGTEGMIQKHLILLKQQLDANNEPSHAKVIIYVPHINRRNYLSWKGTMMKPPKLIDASTSTLTPEDHARIVKIIVTKLYHIADYLSQQPQGTYSKTVSQLSQNCTTYLPEEALVNMLRKSPLLLDLERIVEIQTQVPHLKLYHEYVWPTPPDFVPRHIMELQTENQNVGQNQ